MTNVEQLMKKAMDLKSKGLSNKEISNELHLSLPTIDWLLTRQIKTKKPPGDVKIGWRSIGVYPYRIELISLIMVDIIMEEMAKSNQDVHSIVGIGLNGIPFASFIANNLEKELILYRPHVEDQEVGVFSSNFAGQKGKNVVVVDDVLGSGETISGAIRSVEEAGGKTVLALILVNKTEMNDLNGVPLRALLRTRLIQ